MRNAPGLEPKLWTSRRWLACAGAAAGSGPNDFNRTAERINLSQRPACAERPLNIPRSFIAAPSFSSEPATTAKERKGCCDAAYEVEGPSAQCRGSMTESAVPALSEHYGALKPRSIRQS